MVEESLLVTLKLYDMITTNIVLISTFRHDYNMIEELSLVPLQIVRHGSGIVTP